jgi:glyoxylase-like metal-dependent hydrolase (beta-lactamase superfamily II)/rhodanese-related sulfurtransferase
LRRGHRNVIIEPMLILRQLFDATSSTYTYLLADRSSGQAVLIDPVYEQARRDAALMAELGLTLVWTLETHVHADHVTGAWLLRQRLGSRIALARNGGAEGADRLLGHGDRIEFGARWLAVRATPGHTNGCLTYVLDDESRAFSGDCLLIRGCGRTDFQQGDSRTLYASVRQQIFTLPAACLVYPGHDYNGLTVTSVEEERRYNPRLGGEVSESDFAGHMSNLNLPHPKKLDMALPANLRCGRPEGDAWVSASVDPTWARLYCTFGGLWEINPHALAEVVNSGYVQVVDVREPTEFHGPLGHIPNTQLIPLGTLNDRLAMLDRERPVVAVCRSGSRSARAVAMLQQAGFARVANLAGGMLRWRVDGGMVDNGQE